MRRLPLFQGSPELDTKSTPLVVGATITRSYYTVSPYGESIFT
jgi:hypothetical protein